MLDELVSHPCKHPTGNTEGGELSFTMVEEPETDWTRYDHEVLSQTRYSLCANGMHCISKRSIDRDQQYLACRPKTIGPEGVDLNRSHACTKCGLQMLVRYNYGHGWIFTRFHLFTGITIGHLICPQEKCGQSINFDGHAVGLVNHANYLLIDAQLLLQAANMWKGGTAIKLWWESLCSGYQGYFSVGEWKTIKGMLSRMRGRMTKAIVGFF